MKQPTFSKTSALGHWYGADKIVDYHVVEGRVAISADARGDYSVAVAVPIEFVKFVQDLGHSSEKIELYLDQEEKRWVFGYEMPTTKECVDLWHYTANSFPFWASFKRRL